MKKGIYLFAAIALMAGCSHDNVFVDTPEANPDVSRLIGFDTFVDKATRAADENNSNALEFFYPTFHVYGWKTVGNDVTCVFENIPVSHYDASDADATKPSTEWGDAPETGWYYENIRYWDKMASSYLFSAFTPIPEGVAFDCTSEGLITIGTEENPVTVDGTNLMSTPAEELAYTGFAKDYMTAQAEDKIDKVSLTFSHLQAKLNVRILLDEDITTAQNVAIQNIEIHNLGDVAYYTNADDTGVSGWTLGTRTADYVPAITTVQDGYSLNAENVNFHNYYVLEQLVIPQTVKAVDVDNPSLEEFEDACIYVEYTIGAETFKSFTPLANIFIGEDDAEVYTFEGGKQYTLNITVGPKPICFTAEVTPWEDAVENDLVMD